MMEQDLLEHQYIGQSVLCRLLEQKVPPPTQYKHMIPDICMHSFHIGICRLDICIYLCETLNQMLYHTRSPYILI